MSDIFISYKREEQIMAKMLAVALERYGWSVWWDPHIRVGEHYDDVIEEALRDSTCVIVLWSKESVNSRYVRDEANYALKSEKLIPVVIESVDPPFRFAGLQTANLSGWDGSDAFPGFLKIVDDIRSRIGSRSAVAGEVKPVPREMAERVDVKPKSKPISSKRSIHRTKVEWLSNVVVIAALGLFYVGAVASACSNDDLLALSALIGYPLSFFLIFRRRPYRIVWILAPLTSFFIGMPYGHNFGMMTRSPMFGLEQGTDCQPSLEVLIVLSIVVIGAVIDHVVFLHSSKRK